MKILTNSKKSWWQVDAIRTEVQRLLTNLIESGSEEEDEQDRESHRQAMALIIWGDLRSCVVVNGQ